MIFKNKFFRITILLILILFSIKSNAYATESLENKDVIYNFIHDLTDVNKDYIDWVNAEPKFEHNILNDREDVEFKLYSLFNGNYVGYLILDRKNNVVEFSKGESAYKIFQEKNEIDIINYVTINGLPAVETYEEMFILNFAGEVIEKYFKNPISSNSKIYEGNTNMPFSYSGHKQTISCIPGSIANYMWFQNKYRGYSSLVSYGDPFDRVESEIAGILQSYGGFKNSNIPGTVETYVKRKNKNYIVSATNKWNPSFYDVRNVISNKNYPLVGFAAGSVYSKDVGHMTLCIGTYSRNGTNFVEFLDGHRTEVVSRVWSKYNDYICDIHLRR